MSWHTTAESVRDSLEDSFEKVAGSDLRPQLESAAGQAKDQLGEVIEQVEEFLEETAIPALAEASERAREEAHTFATERAAPALAAGAGIAADQALHVQEKAEEWATAAEESTGRRRTRWVLLAVAGAAGVVAATLVRRRMNHPPADDWASTYPEPRDQVEDDEVDLDAEADPEGHDDAS